ncbi:hypothetical protein IRY61_01360 [Candidatus Saccharibacteria bacterium]|nr:hypothetical protein [Candidatus Saccharibacteria bacterium]
MAASTESLETLHELVTQELTKRIRSGEATAADIAQAIKLLKDNGITAIPTEDNSLGKLMGSLADRLPFTNTDGPIPH